MRVRIGSGLALLALTAAPASLVAQAAAPPAIAASQSILVAAAELRLPSGGAFALERPAGARIIQQAGNRRKGEILMIVGAAGIVTGLLVDEDLITISGAVLGGVGLYLYLQATR